jgi:hypothetical protein
MDGAAEALTSVLLEPDDKVYGMCSAASLARTPENEARLLERARCVMDLNADLVDGHWARPLAVYDAGWVFGRQMTRWGVAGVWRVRG